MSKSRSFVIFKYDGLEEGGFESKKTNQMVRKNGDSASPCKANESEKEVLNNQKVKAQIKEYYQYNSGSQVKKGERPDPYNRRFLQFQINQEFHPKKHLMPETRTPRFK